MSRRDSCRIIAGKWRGRKIQFQDAEGLRPTTDRIRETLFNWLQPELAGSCCLDCFAGSGALGFEAASRGAAQVLMLEKNPQTVRFLQANKQVLSATMVKLYKTDSLQWLAAVSEKADKPACNIVFLDPPYQSNLLQKSCSLLVRSTLLQPDTRIYLEHARTDTLTLPDSWQCLKSKTAGQVVYKLFLVS